ncbi:MAG: hypothetical protein JOZ81_30065 [Chloroflexi bacterium]|nr:hypothetical protein [Chloroflexota bacterium]
MTTTLSDPLPRGSFPVDHLFEQELVDNNIQFERHPALRLDNVRITPEAQVRTGEHQAPPARVERYAVQMRDGSLFPAIVAARRPDEIDLYDLVDGNTRLRAARHKHVLRDTFPAYVLLNVTWAQCREIGVFQNQRNGADLDKAEVLKWVHEALQRGMPLTRISRISGFSYNKVKQLNGVHDFDQRAQRLTMPETVQELPGGAKQLIADELQFDAIFKETAQLAADSAMPVAELKPIVQAIKAAHSEQEALTKLADERRQRQSAIDAHIQAVADGKPGVRPPYPVQMLKHLTFLVDRDPHDLVEHSATTRDNAFKLVEQAHRRLGEALDLYRASEWSVSPSQAAD